MKNVYAEYQFEIKRLRKQVKELEFSKKSLANIAYNAIVFGRLDEEYDKGKLLEELAITEEEWNLIMGEGDYYEEAQ